MDVEMSTPSPYSSPSLEPLDSSPPSSPSLAPVTTPPSSPELIHPFAGSTKATRRPHIYENRNRQLHPYASSSHGASSSRSRDPSSSTNERVLDPLASSLDGPLGVSQRDRRLGRVHFTGSALSDATWGEDVAFGTMDIGCVTEDGNDVLQYLQTEEEREQRIWDAVITRAIDKADGVLDLSQHGYLRTPLTSIPPSIADLAGLVVLRNNHLVTNATSLLPTPQRTTRTLARSITTPEAVFGSGLPGKGKLMSAGLGFGKAASFSQLDGSPESVTNGLQILLVNQAIGSLPLELFSLSALTVLDLRGNALELVPPQIASFRALRELDISQNRLQWLPAEMLNMCLEKLSLTGNPWLAQPILPSSSHIPSTQSIPGSLRTHPTVNVSNTTSHFTLPPLPEVCLRVLLSPVSSGGAKEETVLEALYALPLSGTDRFPASVLKRLRGCIPGAVAKPSTTGPSPAKLQRSRGDGDVRSGTAPSGQPTEPDSSWTPSGIGRCPNPAHYGAVFVDHAEERYTWELTIAGCVVGTLNDGLREPAGVPVRWRGCSPACLDFLDADSHASPPEDDLTSCDAAAEGSGAAEQQEGVRVFHVAGGPLEDAALFD